MSDFDWKQYEEKPQQEFDWAAYSENPATNFSLSTENLANIQQQHPYLSKLAESLQNHPSLNKAIETAAPWAEHFNRAVQGTGLPNLSKGLFTSGENLIRGIASMTPTGAGLPDVNLPKSGISNAEIPEINPHIQAGAEITGKAIPYAAALYQSLPELREIGGAISDLPLTRRMASRSLERAKELANARELGSLNIPENIIEDMRQFLPNTTPYRKLLEEAKAGDYNKLFDLQSDTGKHARDYAKSLFSAAERAHGRAGLQSREELINHMRNSLQETGNADISGLMQRGQNRYRQYMQLQPYRRALAGIALASAPGYKYIKKLLP